VTVEIYSGGSGVHGIGGFVPVPIAPDVIEAAAGCHELVMFILLVFVPVAGAAVG